MNSSKEESTDQKPFPYSFWVGALTLKGSVTPRVIGDVLIFGIISLISVILVSFAATHLGINLVLPVGPFETIGAVLGLMLVLRMNAGYERWWEGRKLWGGIVNQSRNLAITALCYGPHKKEWRDEFVRWVAAFPHISRRSLRNERSFQEIERLLGKENADRITNAEHMPSFIARELGLMLNSAVNCGMNNFAYYEAEKQRSLLVDHLGGCERIKSTPLSRATAINVRRFILMFLVTLPFALMGEITTNAGSNFILQTASLKIWSVPLFVMIVAYPILALERLGMELQNPFETNRLDFLPLDQICLKIEKNLLSLLSEDPHAKHIAPSADTVIAPPDASFHEKLNPLATDIS